MLFSGLLKYGVRVSIGLLGAAFLYGATYLGYHKLGGNTTVRGYVESEYGSIIERIEKNTGIIFERKLGIVYDELLPPWVHGAYYESSKLISLNTILTQTPQKDFRNTLSGILNFGTSQNLEGIVAHEAGHHIFNTILGRLGGYNPARNSDEKFIKAFTLINEGLAEYFRFSLHNVAAVSPGGSKSKILGFIGDLFYYLKYGFNPYTDSRPFVFPLIAKYGTIAIPYLIANLPKEEELENPVKYRERIEGILSEKPWASPTCERLESREKKGEFQDKRCVFFCVPKDNRLDAKVTFYMFFCKSDNEEQTGL